METGLDLDKLTDDQLKGYLAGDLRLVTSRSTGESTLKPVGRKNKRDKGVTDQKKREYWKLWYLKNRTARMKYNNDRSTRVRIPAASAAKATPTPPSSSTVRTKETFDRALYMAAYRRDNRERLRKEGIERYHRLYSVKAKAAKGIQAPAKAAKAPKAPKAPVSKRTYHRRSWLERLLGFHWD